MSVASRKRQRGLFGKHLDAKYGKGGARLYHVTERQRIEIIIRQNAQRPGAVRRRKQAERKRQEQAA